MTDALPPYFRRDRAAGITAPDLSKVCTYAEHIVRARGKRTQFTSVSRDHQKIRDFDGETLYRLLRDSLAGDGHGLVEHEALVANLMQTILEVEKADRARAIQALRRARHRVEGLVEWKFDTDAVPPKDLINWAEPRVQKYFVKV